MGGTNNGLGGGGGGLEFGYKNWLFWGMGSGQRTGNYHTPIGEIENSFSDIVQTSAGFGHYAPKKFFTLSYGLQDGNYGVPPAAAGEEVSIDWRRHNVRLHGGFRDLQGWLDSFRATVNYSDWRHFEMEADQIGTRFRNRQGTWQALFQQAKRGRFSGTFGAWGMHRGFKTQGAEALTPPVDQNAVAAFAVEEVNFERFRIQFGGRVEHNGYSPGGGLEDRSFTGASGSAGLWVRTWGGGAVVANYTSSYRAPALEELYNHGPHLGNLTFEIGNPALTRERAHGFEVSLRQNTGRIRTELSAYRNRIVDFVYLAPTGQIREGLIEAVYDQADARYLGAEARFDYRLVDGLWLNTRFDYVDAQLTMSRLSLPRIPPARGVIALDWQHGGFNLHPELILTNRQWQIFPTETPTAGYGLFNLLASYTIAGVHRTHMFSVNWFNATDQLYRNHLSFIKQFAPEIGQGVRFMYTLNFY
jgi:iron complex outermembrane receptor protein